MKTHVFLATIALAWLAPIRAQADAFDQYTNEILAKVPAANGTRKLEQLPQALMVEHARTLPGLTAALVVVKTGEGRLCKLLVMPARQKVGDISMPILLIERFVTYREGEERTIHAQGHNIRLFPGFRFNLDLGQVVPDALPADLRFLVQGDHVLVEPLGKSELYLVTRHLPEADPKTSPRPAAGTPFSSRFFDGVYKLYDDGRRSGTLHLKLGDDGIVQGHYYSGKDGQKYEVSGKVGPASNAIQFHITYPRSVQQFQGWIFTGDGQAITGSARLQEKETGFYAIRLEK